MALVFPLLSTRAVLPFCVHAIFVSRSVRIAHQGQSSPRTDKHAHVTSVDSTLDVQT